MDIRQLVGLNVRHYRTQKGWSQEQLSFESGLHRTYLGDIERGVRNPTVVVLEKIALPLGIEVFELLRDYRKRAKNPPGGVAV